MKMPQSIDTLAGALRMIAEKKISAEELTAEMLTRTKRLNSEYNAFITVVAPERAGLPVSIKDLYDTQGIRTTAGSKLFDQRMPDDDSDAVAKLKAAGAVIIGKANLHEFAYGVTTINPHYGTALNPWDRGRVCGGSSGGSACAVALGMGLASLGTDTGGSIRIPAAFCGIVGLKPTYGLVSTRGIVPLSWSFDTAGPMTRTVEDAAIVLEWIAEDASIGQYTHALTRAVRGLRIGIPENYFFDNLDSQIAKVIDAAIREFEKLGADVVKIEMPDMPIHRAVWLQIASPEAYSFHERRLHEHADAYGADVRGRLEAGRELKAIDYVRAHRARTLIKENYKQLFNRVDVIVTPAVPSAAPRIEDAPAAARFLTRFTRYFNNTGSPAISIPCGFTNDGLPIGMQITGKAFNDATVLRAAYAYEQSAGWFERRPIAAQPI